MSRNVTSDRSQASVQPPPCPFSDRTYPWSRSPAMIRRITTGLVFIAFASISEVAGPPRSAMCSRTWSTPDNLLSRLMQHHMLHDGVKVKTLAFVKVTSQSMERSEVVRERLRAVAPTDLVF